MNVLKTFKKLLGKLTRPSQYLTQPTGHCLNIQEKDLGRSGTPFQPKSPQTLPSAQYYWRALLLCQKTISFHLKT